MLLLAGCRVSRPDLPGGPGGEADASALVGEDGKAPQRTYVCKRATEPPPLEGTFEEGPWQQASWTEDFVVVRRRGSAVSVRTRAKLLWDDGYLYCVVELLEPQAADPAAASPRHDVDLMVADEEAHPSYEIQLCGMGAMIDTRFDGPEGGRSGDRKWDSKGVRTSRQHSSDGATMRSTAGFALPWSTLAKDPGADAAPPLAPKPGAVWRVDMGRTTWRPMAVEEEGVPQQDAFEKAAWQPPADPAEPRGWGAVQFAP